MSVNKYKYNLGNALVLILIIEVIFWAFAIASYRYLTTNVEEFRFEREYVLYGLIFIPIAILLYFYATHWKNKTLIKYANEKLLPYVYTGISSFKSITKFILLRPWLSIYCDCYGQPSIW